MPILDGLVDQHLIDRHIDPTDRRRRVINLTTTGQSAADDLAKSATNIETEFLHGLDPTDPSRTQPATPDPARLADSATTRKSTVNYQHKGPTTGRPNDQVTTRESASSGLTAHDMSIFAGLVFLGCLTVMSSRSVSNS